MHIILHIREYTGYIPILQLCTSSINVFRLHVQMLESGGNSAAGGVILLVTSGSPLPLTPYDVEQMAAVVTQRGVKVVPIVYPVTDRNPKPTPGVEKLAMLSGTSSRGLRSQSWVGQVLLGLSRIRYWTYGPD